MANNPLFRASNSPTNTTKPTKAVNQTGTKVRLTHNTFDNSYFNFKTQRFGQYEPFWWKPVVAGDNEPYSNSHNVRSLPFASPVLSPMKLNKDYFQVPMYAIQPNTWDYIFKNPTQGDDVPYDAQDLFPLQSSTGDPDFLNNCCSYCQYLSQAGATLEPLTDAVFDENYTVNQVSASARLVFSLLMLENFLSSGSLLYNLGYKFNPVFYDDENNAFSFDEFFDSVFLNSEFTFVLKLDNPDSVNGYNQVGFLTSNAYLNQEFAIMDGDGTRVSYDRLFVVDHFTALSLLRSHISDLVAVNVSYGTGARNISYFDSSYEVSSSSVEGFVDPLNCIRMDVILAYQLSCAQYYVNPRVDFLYNAQLYRDNFIQLLRNLYQSAGSADTIPLASFDYNGLPVLYDYFSYYYFKYISGYIDDVLKNRWDLVGSATGFNRRRDLCAIINYLFGYREQLRFGNYFTDSRTQALGYGEPGSDVVQVYDNAVSVTDMSQKLVLERFRGAVAHLDNSAEDYLSTMFHEQLPPDYHYPKFIAHSEFAINGEEVTNTTSDNQGNIVTNLKSGEDTAEFNIEVSVPSILIGVSYISIPEVYSQIKERHYMHADRYDMFQPMLQYFGDQEIYNREVSDYIPNPGDSYGYTSRNGEYKQRLSQVSGAFLTSLRSWVFSVDLPAFAKESFMPRLVSTQSPLAIRCHDFEFNRFLSRQTGLSLGTGFHFIMQYNNKNVDNRPMDVNPLPLYPNNSL